MPLIHVSGSERFVFQERSSDELRAIASESVSLHTIDAADELAIDPLTYEVIRHRLSAITDDMGDALKRMSGSVVVTDCNDFCAAIADETGDLILVGQYNMQLAASMDMAIKWTLEHRSNNPGLRPGDMFFCNDPWIGGGLHQNDASLFAPLFYDGRTVRLERRRLPSGRSRWRIARQLVGGRHRRVLRVDPGASGEDR